MAEAEWATLTGTALTSGDVARGVSAAFSRVKADAGSFTFAYHAITSTTGVAGYYYNVTNFNPITGTTKCGSIRAVMKKYSSGTTYSPMIGFITGTDPATAGGYILGLSEGSSYYIALKKGTPGSGMLISGGGILEQSTMAYTTVGDGDEAWFHLRLDVLVNPHGEVVLKAWMNDAETNGVLSPTWEDIDGMDGYIDDAVGALSGSVPYLTGFYGFFGMYVSNLAGAVALFDHIEVHRQTSP